MKALTKFALALMTAAVLAACGDSGSSASDSKPVTVQTADGEITLKGKYADIIGKFPEADPNLAEPIAISDQKSPTGLEDLKKVIEFTTGEEAMKISKMGSDLQQMARKNDEAAALKAINELTAELDKYLQKAAALDVKDPEVKTVLDRMVATSKTANSMMIHAAENASALTINMKDKEAVQFMKAYQEKTSKTADILSKANMEAQKAGEALGKKYAR